MEPLLHNFGGLCKEVTLHKAACSSYGSHIRFDEHHVDTEIPDYENTLELRLHLSPVLLPRACAHSVRIGENAPRWIEVTAGQEKQRLAAYLRAVRQSLRQEECRHDWCSETALRCRVRARYMRVSCNSPL